MKNKLLIVTGLMAGLFANLARADADLPLGAAQAVPLAVGSHLPAVTVKTAAGEDYDLAAHTANKPTIIIFYRGGWCPYCNRHLSELQDAEPQLLALGYQILALSTDRPEDLHVMTDKHHLTYTLLSDRQMKAAAAFQVAFKLPEAEMKQYEAHHIDLPSIPSDPAGRWLPVPSVFIVDGQGTIKFVYANPDFKTRIALPALLAAAKSAAP
jgi:peroxiredoxin